MNILYPELQLIINQPIIQHKLKELLSNLKTFVSQYYSESIRTEIIVKFSIPALKLLPVTQRLMKHLNGCVKVLWKKKSASEDLVVIQTTLKHNIKNF